MRPNYTYRIVVAAGGIFEVWGKNPATGYEWLIAEYHTREQARMMVKHWQEAAT